jgi:hypothetical protein
MKSTLALKVAAALFAAPAAAQTTAPGKSGTAPGQTGQTPGQMQKDKGTPGSAKDYAPGSDSSKSLPPPGSTQRANPDPPKKTK